MADIDKLKCQCGRTYSWTGNCRKCDECHKSMLGKKMSDSSKLKARISALKYIEKMSGNRIIPRYNINSISIIEQFGKENGYTFQHAENGGEFHIKELGYFVDAYDVEKNVVLEIDERHHFDTDGNLRERDITRQSEIEKFLGCKFIRLSYEKQKI